MVNALIEHEATIVDRNDLAWRGTENRTGLRDITITMYSKSYMHFAKYFSDTGNVMSNKACICSEALLLRMLQDKSHLI